MYLRLIPVCEPLCGRTEVEGVREWGLGGVRGAASEEGSGLGAFAVSWDKALKNELLIRK